MPAPPYRTCPEPPLDPPDHGPEPLHTGDGACSECDGHGRIDDADEDGRCSLECGSCAGTGEEPCEWCGSGDGVQHMTRSHLCAPCLHEYVTECHADDEARARWGAIETTAAPVAGAAE